MATAVAHTCANMSCISADTEIRRRPYHRNCTCALHLSHSASPNTPCTAANISFPVIKSWKTDLRITRSTP